VRHALTDGYLSSAARLSTLASKNAQKRRRGQSTTSRGGRIPIDSHPRGPSAKEALASGRREGVIG